MYEMIKYISFLRLCCKAVATIFYRASYFYFFLKTRQSNLDNNNVPFEIVTIIYNLA